MTLKKLTDELSVYLSSKIPDIDIHTLEEIIEFLVYKIHNFTIDMLNTEKERFFAEFKQADKNFRNEIRRINRAWEKDVRRIDKKYEYMANHLTQEVVRCKGCKYNIEGKCFHPKNEIEKKIPEIGQHYRLLLNITVEDNHYCSYGERRGCK